MKLFSKLTRFSDWGLLALRIGIAVVFFAHGTFKWGVWGMEPSEQLPCLDVNDPQDTVDR